MSEPSGQSPVGTRPPVCQSVRGTATTDVADAQTTADAAADTSEAVSGLNIPEPITADQARGTDTCTICLEAIDPSDLSAQYEAIIKKWLSSFTPLRRKPGHKAHLHLPSPLRPLRSPHRVSKSTPPPSPRRLPPDVAALATQIPSRAPHFHLVLERYDVSPPLSPSRKATTDAAPDADPFAAPLVRLPHCSHIFHGACAGSWLAQCERDPEKIGTQCPNCRVVYYRPGSSPLDVAQGRSEAQVEHFIAEGMLNAEDGILEGVDFSGLIGVGIMGSGVDGEEEWDGEDDVLSEEDLEELERESEEDRRTEERDNPEREQQWEDMINNVDWVVASTDVRHNDSLERGTGVEDA